MKKLTKEEKEKRKVYRKIYFAERRRSLTEEEKTKLREYTRIKANEYYHRQSELQKQNRSDYFKAYSKRRFDNEGARLRWKYYLIERTYHTSIEKINNILLNQSNRCPICNKILLPIPNKHTHIDHNHKSNEVRGILCSNCNLGLGNFKDNITVLYNAIKYLEQYK